LAIHLKRKHQNPDSFDLDLIARCCEGFSGAEIQVLINESIFEAAYRGERLHTNHLLEEIRKTTPLSVTMKDKIEAIRNWAKTHNVRPAS
jgi:SpoVK/Ycf46/Vps4 family AAA+-type ATPase